MLHRVDVWPDILDVLESYQASKSFLNLKSQKPQISLKSAEQSCGETWTPHTTGIIWTRRMGLC